MTYLTELEEAIGQIVADEKVLLEESKNIIGLMRINGYIKQKTVFRMDIYSAMYQRIAGIISLTESKQTNAANIMLRSIWELLATHSFVGMHTGNKYLEILKAIDAQGTKKQWRAIQTLRANYPNSNTWEEQWSDQVIQDRIDWAERRLASFRLKNPNVNINSYERILDRLKAIDDYNLNKYPNYKNLLQMDYRTVYSLLSDDVHSSLYGLTENSRLTQTGLQVRLDKFDLDTLRNITTSYNMLLDFTAFLSRHYRLGQGSAIKIFRDTEKQHHQVYKSFEARREDGMRNNVPQAQW